MLDTRPFLDFDPDSYPLFFQHLDQRLSLHLDCWQLVGQIPDTSLLTNLSVSRLNTLWLSQFVPNLLPIGTSKPDVHGNWKYTEPITGSALDGRLWQSVPSLQAFEWVCELFDLPINFYSRPMTVGNFSYTNPIGIPYFRLSGNSGLIEWVSNWIEPNCYPLGTGLAGTYLIGSQFLPIVDANLIQISSDDPLTSTEPNFNTTGWLKATMVARKPETANQIGWVSRTATQVDVALAGEILVSPSRVTQAEGSGTLVGWAADRVETAAEGTNETANLIGWTQRTVTNFGEND